MNFVHTIYTGCVKVPGQQNISKLNISEKNVSVKSCKRFQKIY